MLLGLNRYRTTNILPTSRKKREIWATLYCFSMTVLLPMTVSLGYLALFARCGWDVWGTREVQVSAIRHPKVEA
jgi:hypothetical protein